MCIDRPGTCVINCGPHKYKNKNFWRLLALESYFGFLQTDYFFFSFFFGVCYQTLCPRRKSGCQCTDIRREIMLLIGKFICCKHFKSIFLFLIWFLTLALCCAGWLRDQIVSRLLSGEYFHSYSVLFLWHILACSLIFSLSSVNLHTYPLIFEKFVEISFIPWCTSHYCL